jgi:hypothetical protein
MSNRKLRNVFDFNQHCCRNDASNSPAIDCQNPNCATDPLVLRPGQLCSIHSNPAFLITLRNGSKDFLNENNALIVWLVASFVCSGFRTSASLTGESVLRRFCCFDVPAQ